MAQLNTHLTRSIGIAVGALVATTLPTIAIAGAEAPTDGARTAGTSATSFTFIRPAPSGVPLGVFRRADGHWFARTSGTTTGTVEPTAVDAEPGTFAPPASTLPAPQGTFDAETGIFREPVDLSTHADSTTPGRSVIRVSDGIWSATADTALYFQTVTAVRSTTTAIPGSDNVIVRSSVTDQYGQPVTGALVRLTGYASGSRTPVAQYAVTDGAGAVTFTGPGDGSGPAVPAGYATGFYTAYADLDLNGSRGSREAGYESVVGTVAYAAPGKAFFHSDARIAKAGGVLADSIRGTRAAAARRYTWIDQDGQLAFSSLAVRHGGVARVASATHLTWVNAHGAPFNPRWLGKGRFENRAWSRIKSRPGLRNAEMTFQQNAAYHLSVEWEVKDIRPFTTPAALDAAFANLATVAVRYYGPSWQSRVQVKTLSNLSGGQDFAMRVLQAAHAHGFTTIYLARGKATRIQIPAAAHTYVTYVRGARGGLYAPIPPASQNTPIQLTEPPLPVG